VVVHINPWQNRPVVAKPLDRRDFLETGLSFMHRTPRNGDRIPCRATVACFLGDAGFYGTIENISAKGMYVGSDWRSLRGMCSS
jgi:hypothetical protein